MPYKYLEQKGVNIPKQKYKVNNWSEYNEALRRRGDIEIWLSQEVIDNWYTNDRIYDGTGTPDLYTNTAIIACHEIRKVFKLPLRQSQGFIDSLFRAKDLPITCPDFSSLSKRLARLDISCPRYKNTDRPDDDLAAIAFDSTGLKRFGRDEWHQEKHKISANRSWRKLHIGVDEKHFIQGCVLTDRYSSDDKTIEDVADQIKIPVGHCAADGAYDKNPVYDTLSEHFPKADIIIPPSKNAVLRKDNHPKRNTNILEVICCGRMDWQKRNNYGQRNYSELAIQRYKRILGNTMQSRELERQKQEAMIGCGILNKMTGLGMPESYRVT